MPLPILANDRVFIAGQSGSGKTFFARALLARASRLLVLDPKGLLSPEAAPDWRLTDWTKAGAKRLEDGRPVRLRVPAPLDGDWEPYLMAAYRARNVVVYIDEAYGVVRQGKKLPPSLVALYTRGRELGIGMIAASQRPSWVPLEMMSEANKFFIFRLMLPEDRKRVAGFVGESAMGRIPDRHGFLTYSIDWDYPVYTPQLNVRTGRRTATARR